MFHHYMNLAPTILLYFVSVFFFDFIEDFSMTLMDITFLHFILFS